MSLPKIEEIQLDDEFRNLNRVLTDEERKGLTGSIKLDGILDPLRAWYDGDKWLLVDGYNRYDIWHGEGGDSPSVKTVPSRLKDRDAVIDWLLEWQLNRRNLHKNDRAYLLGTLYNRHKSNPVDNLKKGLKSPSGKRYHSGKILKKLTSKSGNSEKTVRNAGKFKAAIDAITENLGPKAGSDVASGVVSKKDAIAIAELPADEQGKAFGRAKLGKPIEPEASKEQKDYAGEVIPKKLTYAFEAHKHFEHARQCIARIQEDALIIMDELYGTRDERSKKPFSAKSIQSMAAQMFRMFDENEPRFVCKQCNGDGCTKCHERGYKCR